MKGEAILNGAINFSYPLYLRPLGWADGIQVALDKAGCCPSPGQDLIQGFRPPEWTMQQSNCHFNQGHGAKRKDRILSVSIASTRGAGYVEALVAVMSRSIKL